VCLFSFFPLRSGFCAGSGAYRLEVPDAEAMGKGSAFVAQADNPSAVYYNPAGLTQLKGNTYFSVGASVIQPFCTYKSTTDQETDRRKQIFTIPNGYAVTDFGLDKVAFGIGATSYWGLGTYWAEDSFSKYVATKSDVITQDVMLTAAYEINDNLSIGAGVDYTKALANKKKKMNQSAWGGADGDFELKGRDNNAWGWRLSTLYKVNQHHSFGLMYRSAVDLVYKGKVYLNDLNGTYAALFGGSSYETDISTKSRLPQSILLGYCFKPDDKWRFEFDVEWMDWSSVDNEQIDYPSLSAADPKRGVLDAGNPISRDWRGVMSYAFGTEYKVNDKWKLRMGYFFHKTPIPQGTFDTALPDATSNSITLGTGYKINKNVAIDFAYAGMFYNSRKINNAVGSSSGVNINGTYDSFINIYMLTVTVKL